MLDGGSNGFGGGVFNNGIFTMNGGKIRNNVAAAGGGVSNSGTFTMNSGTIRNNEATSSWQGGGGISSGGILTMNGGAILNNTANQNGGGIDARIVTINGGKIRGNVANQNGGGISVLARSSSVFDPSAVIINGGMIKDNVANQNGGGIFISPPHPSFPDPSTVIINESTIKNNTASDGGGIFLNHDHGYLSRLTITEDVVMTGNVATNGMRLRTSMVVDNPQISPGTVSASWHPFTNHDINVLQEYIMHTLRYNVDNVMIERLIKFGGDEINERGISESEMKERANYTFIGWYTEGENGYRWCFETMYMPKEDLDLFARFERNVDTGTGTGDNENHDDNENDENKTNDEDEEDRGIAGGVYQTEQTPPRQGAGNIVANTSDGINMVSYIGLISIGLFGMTVLLKEMKK